MPSQEKHESAVSVFTTTEWRPAWTSRHNLVDLVRKTYQDITTIPSVYYVSGAACTSNTQRRDGAAVSLDIKHCRLD